MALATGAICDESLDASRVRADRPLLLSRALCRFRRFSAVEGLSEGQVARAAMLDAEVHAPFEHASWMIIRDNAGAEIWYWDKAQLAARTEGHEPPLLIAPESVFAADGEGWRIVAVAEGFEAQYWEGGALQASMWRREAYSESDWASFVVGVDHSSVDAPGAPPEHEHAILLARPPRLERRIRPPWGWRDAERATLLAAACFAALAAFFGSAGVRHELDRRATDLALKQVELTRASDPALKKLRTDREQAGLYRAVAPGAPLLSAAARAVSMLEAAGYDIQGWRIDEKTFSATLKPGAQAVPVRDAAAKLEADPVFRNVAPTFLGGERGIVIEAAVVSGSGGRAK